MATLKWRTAFSALVVIELSVFSVPLYQPLWICRQFIFSFGGHGSYNINVILTNIKCLVTEIQDEKCIWNVCFLFSFDSSIRMKKMNVEDVLHALNIKRLIKNVIIWFGNHWIYMYAIDYTFKYILFLFKFFCISSNGIYKEPVTQTIVRLSTPHIKATKKRKTFNII